MRIWKLVLFFLFVLLSMLIFSLLLSTSEQRRKINKKVNDAIIASNKQQERIYHENEKILNTFSEQQQVIKELDRFFKNFNPREASTQKTLLHVLHNIKNQKYTPQEEEKIAKYLLDILINTPIIEKDENSLLMLMLEILTKIKHPEAFKILREVFMKLFLSQNPAYEDFFDSLIFQDPAEAGRLFTSLIDQTDEEKLISDLSYPLKKIAQMGKLDSSSIQVIFSKIEKSGSSEHQTKFIRRFSSIIAASKEPSAIEKLIKLFFEGHLNYWQKMFLAGELIKNVPDKFVPVIQSYYHSNHHDIETRRAILKSLSSFPKGYVGQPVWDISRQIIISGFTDPSPSIREVSAEAASYDAFADEIFIPYLTNLLNDPSPDVVESAKKAIEVISRIPQSPK